MLGRKPRDRPVSEISRKMTQAAVKSAASSTSAKPQEAGFGQIIRSLIPLALIFGLRSLPLDDVQLLLLGRSVFGVRVVIVIAICAFIYYRIISTASTEKVKAHEKALGFGGQSELIPEMTVQEYDNAQLGDFIKKEGMQIALILFLHYQFGIVQPLILSSVMGLMPLLDNDLIKLYIRNSPVSRPFEDKTLHNAGPLAALFAPPAAEDKKKD